MGDVKALLGTAISQLIHTPAYSRGDDELLVDVDELQVAVTQLGAPAAGGGGGRVLHERAQDGGERGDRVAMALFTVVSAALLVGGTATAIVAGVTGRSEVARFGLGSAGVGLFFVSVVTGAVWQEARRALHDQLTQDGGRPDHGQCP